MPTQQLSFKLGGSHREWLTLRMSTNPISATGGPLPQLNIPLEARILTDGIEIQLLRLAYDLKLGTTVVGRGEIGPLTYLRTTEQYIPATATLPAGSAAVSSQSFTAARTPHPARCRRWSVRTTASSWSARLPRGWRCPRPHRASVRQHRPSAMRPLPALRSR